MLGLPRGDALGSLPLLVSMYEIPIGQPRVGGKEEKAKIQPARYNTSQERPVKGSRAMVIFPWKRLPTPPAWDWIQVEVTTRCNALCSYCPRTVYGKSWPERDLPLEIFRRLLPDLPRARHVHLQGWGEPLLHPEFFQMARLARKAGCQVGTTTNGTLLDQELARELVATGIDVVAFSLAGTGPKNDALRRGAPLGRVMAGILSLLQARSQARSRVPEIHIAYMLLGSALEELVSLPHILRGLPVGQVVVSTLDCVLDASLEREVVGESTPELLSCLNEMGKRLAAQGTLLHHHLGGKGGSSGPCTENVLRAMVVGADGEVTPCVYTNLDVPRARQFRAGGEKPLERLSFGNLAQRSLRSIWEDQAYQAFRQFLLKGFPLGQCQGCPKLGRP